MNSDKRYGLQGDLLFKNMTRQT